MFKYSLNTLSILSQYSLNTLSILSSILQILSSILPITLPITLPTCRYASPRSLNTLTVCRYASQTLSPRTATLVHASPRTRHSATVLHYSHYSHCIRSNTRRPIHAASGSKPYRELRSIRFTLRTRTT